jgi:hypothetical protein
MKRVIDGKRYDTDTAQRIAGAESSCNPGDFRYWEETLYRTKRGAYFIHGEGGAMSRWSRPVGSNGQTGGEGIEVLTEDEARQWCENRGIDADVIAEFFEIEDA